MKRVIKIGNKKIRVLKIVEILLGISIVAFILLLLDMILR